MYYKMNFITYYELSSLFNFLLLNIRWYRENGTVNLIQAAVYELWIGIWLYFRKLDYKQYAHYNKSYDCIVTSLYIERTKFSAADLRQKKTRSFLCVFFFILDSLI